MDRAACVLIAPTTNPLRGRGGAGPRSASRRPRRSGRRRCRPHSPRGRACPSKRGAVPLCDLRRGPREVNLPESTPLPLLSVSLLHSIFLSLSFSFTLFPSAALRVILRNFSNFSVASRNFAELHVTWRALPSLCVTMRHYASLCFTLRHFAPLCAVLRISAPFCTTLRRFASLCITLFHEFALKARFPTFGQPRG